MTLSEPTGQGAESTDDQYFREQQSSSEENSRKPIKMRLPAVRLVDIGVPEEVAKLQNYLHELLGHFGWGLIREALPFLVDEDLVKYLKKVTSLPSAACSGCIEGKSKCEPLPSGKTDRPRAIERDEKVYPSAGHKYHYYMATCENILQIGGSAETVTD
jgi:hypothetical protein